MKMYLVKEIFGPTIQGEGSHTGRPCMFVRMSNCNRWSGRAEDKADSICNYCDTDFVGGERMNSDLILDKVKAEGMEAVVITGGEPMLQVRDGDLINTFIQNGVAVMIETNGSIPFSSPKDLILRPNVHVTISPKQSWADTKLLHQLKRLNKPFDLKMLYPWIGKGITTAYFHDGERIYIQPVDRPDEDNTKAAFDCVAKHAASGAENVYLSMQTHKYAGFE